MSPDGGRPRERVLIETPRYRMEGEVMLPPQEGYRSRLSDFLNDQNREFLIVLDVRMTRLDDPDEVTGAAVECFTAVASTSSSRATPDGRRLGGCDWRGTARPRG